MLTPLGGAILEEPDLVPSNDLAAVYNPMADTTEEFLKGARRLIPPHPRTVPT